MRSVLGKTLTPISGEPLMTGVCRVLKMEVRRRVMTCDQRETRYDNARITNTHTA